MLVGAIVLKPTLPRNVTGITTKNMTGFIIVMELLMVI